MKLLLGLLLICAACSAADGTRVASVEVDASDDATADAMVDASLDASLDAMVDAAKDAMVQDAAMDSSLPDATPSYSGFRVRVHPDHGVVLFSLTSMSIRSTPYSGEASATLAECPAGFELANVDDAAKRNWVTSALELLSYSPISGQEERNVWWTGGSQSDANGLVHENWSWPDGSAISESAWHSRKQGDDPVSEEPNDYNGKSNVGELDNHVEDCAVINYWGDGALSDLRCSFPLQFICTKIETGQ